MFWSYCIVFIMLAVGGYFILMLIGSEFLAILVLFLLIVAAFAALATAVTRMEEQKEQLDRLEEKLDRLLNGTAQEAPQEQPCPGENEHDCGNE